MTAEIKGLIDSIPLIDRGIETDIKAHLDDLTKPRGSLGRLEEIALRYCLIRGTTKPAMGRKRIVVFAGDHGVTGEGVSAYPRGVTPQMVRNMLAGGAAINVFARHVGAELKIVDIGVDDWFDGVRGLVRRKIRPGTNNIAIGPAMSVEEAAAAVRTGAGLAFEAADEGVTLIGTGEIGIGNTTPSSAVLAALLPCNVEQITGRGTGVDDDGLARKINVIKKALEVNRERLSDPLEVLAAVGGLEIAGICGLVLGAASRGIPAVVDGFISSAGALAACRMCEAVCDYLFFSHRSAEAGHRTFFEVFSVRPLLDLDMRLGEGTGAALAMSLVEVSVNMYNDMATFSSAGVSNSERPSSQG